MGKKIVKTTNRLNWSFELATLLFAAFQWITQQLWLVPNSLSCLQFIENGLTFSLFISEFFAILVQIESWCQPYKKKVSHPYWSGSCVKKYCYRYRGLFYKYIHLMLRWFCCDFTWNAFHLVHGDTNDKICFSIDLFHPTEWLRYTKSWKMDIIFQEIASHKEHQTPQFNMNI